jgi:hypothetical protein
MKSPMRRAGALALHLAAPLGLGAVATAAEPWSCHCGRRATGYTAVRTRAMRLLHATTLLLLVALPSTGAAAGAADRTGAFAKLPDWTGIWETEGAAASVSGARARVAAASAARLPRNFKRCVPVGFPTIMTIPLSDFMFELLVTPEQTLLAATDGTVRHIYTDGRSHPSPEDLWPTRMGDSIGRWEGATLVVDTIGREAGRISPFPESPDLSDAAHFTERLRRIDADTMEDSMTIEDPQRLEQPLHLAIRYLRVKDVDRIIPVDCEHDRNTVGENFEVAPP